MQGRFKYELLNRYPRLRPVDAAIWERFVAKNPSFLERVDYDVKVGFGTIDFSSENIPIRDNYAELTKKRIDVMGYKDGTIYIIELKPRASFSALGQVLGYEFLYRQSTKYEGKIQKVVITDFNMPDIQSIYNHFDVKRYIV